MKLGILISCLMVIAIIIVLVFALRGVPENPTNATKAENLELRTDVSDLPRLYEEKGGDAWAEYQAIFQFSKDNSAIIGDVIDEKNEKDEYDPPAEIADKAMDLFIRAYEAGTVTQAQLDSTMAFWPNAMPDIGSPEDVALLALRRAQAIIDSGNPGDKDRAWKCFEAAMSVGDAMFRKSQRLVIRYTGLEIMKAAITELWTDAEAGSERGAQFEKWEVAVNKFEAGYWLPKNEAVFSLRPNVGDLLNIALYDKDLSWKLEATLALGRIKWNPRTKGNLSAINRAISTLKGSSDDVIKRAAELAEKFSKEDVHTQK